MPTHSCLTSPPFQTVLPQYVEAYSERICKYSRAPALCIKNMRVPPPLKQEQMLDMSEQFPEPLQGTVLGLLAMEDYEDVQYLIDNLDVYNKIASLGEKVY